MVSVRVNFGGRFISISVLFSTILIKKTIIPLALVGLVFFAAVIRVVTHGSLPLTAAHSSSAFLSSN